MNIVKRYSCAAAHDTRSALKHIRNNVLGNASRAQETIGVAREGKSL